MESHKTPDVLDPTRKWREYRSIMRLLRTLTCNCTAPCIYFRFTSDLLDTVEPTVQDLGSRIGHWSSVQTASGTKAQCVLQSQLTLYVRSVCTYRRMQEQLKGYCRIHTCIEEEEEEEPDPRLYLAAKT